MDIASLIAFNVSPVELIIRGSVIYLLLFALFRIVLKREAGSLSMTDLLLVVLVADAAQNGMAGDYTTVSEGLILIGTLAFWSYALNWLAHQYSWFEKLTHPKPLALIEGGQLLRRNLRRELITEEELISQIRRQGLTDFKQVDRAFLEGDGTISVIPSPSAQ
jgi:uncharacterized membrane protein YcaP (DUF421 family)